MALQVASEIGAEVEKELAEATEFLLKSFRKKADFALRESRRPFADKVVSSISEARKSLDHEVTRQSNEIKAMLSTLDAVRLAEAPNVTRTAEEFAFARATQTVKTSNNKFLGKLAIDAEAADEAKQRAILQNTSANHTVERLLEIAVESRKLVDNIEAQSLLQGANDFRSDVDLTTAQAKHSLSVSDLSARMLVEAKIDFIVNATEKAELAAAKAKAMSEDNTKIITKLKLKAQKLFQKNAVG